MRGRVVPSDTRDARVQELDSWRGGLIHDAHRDRRLRGLLTDHVVEDETAHHRAERERRDRVTPGIDSIERVADPAQRDDRGHDCPTVGA